MLMQLMFLATRTSPDILTAVCALATKYKEPLVIGYLAEYKDLELHCKVTDLQLNAYFDAGWACHSDMKGHSGMVLTLGHFGFPILYKSQKQKVVTRSSTEAKLVYMYSLPCATTALVSSWKYLTKLHCQSTRTILRP